MSACRPVMQRQHHEQQGLRPAQLQHQHHELQGRPRPASLIVTHKASPTTMMKKRRRRHPVIIYVESPKVVHAHPSEFRSVVQRLTGAPPSSATAALPPHQLRFQMYRYHRMDMDMNCGRGPSPFVARAMSPTSYLPGGASSSDQQLRLSPAFLFEDQNMASQVASPATPAVQANYNNDLMLVPSMGGVNHRFTGQ